MNNVHFESGTSNEIAIVLSCPGQEEENANPPRPAKGQTGKNLEEILNILSNNYNLKGFSRKQIVITNSWDQVEYKTKTKRSEATLFEVLKETNLDRLTSEVKGISKFIIACGINAKSALMALDYAKKLNKSTKIIFIEHLGNQALNANITKDLNGNKIKSYAKAADKPKSEIRSLVEIRKNNKQKRLEVLANRINSQI